MGERGPNEPFAYDLPEERIAQRPVHPFDSAKLLVIRRGDSSIADSEFTSLPEFLTKSDRIIFNDTRVMPSRLFGSIEGGEREIEILLLKETAQDTWRALGRPMKRMRPGAVITFTPNLTAEILSREGTQEVSLRFSSPSSAVKDAILETAVMPIPPYIRDGRGDSQDVTDYQTMFAKVEGSIAAPTASLHFTPDLVKSIDARGCAVSYVTLHVGSPSFTPLWREGEGGLTPPGKEFFVFSKKLLREVQTTKEEGGRVIAVGTTVVRALESMMNEASNFSDGELSSTTLFISPGYKFRAVDSLITNFHQPYTSHLLLVEAFMGSELLSASYNHALQSNYRFLSYGDGMFIL